MATTLKWDEVGSHWYEAGVSHGVLYPMTKDTSGKPVYGSGVVWNGLTSVSESPEGADANDLWADNIKYASLRSVETFGGSIEAYTYPDEWAECDGSKAIGDGVMLGQQPRKSFGLCYRTEQGNDIDSNIDDGYKIHIIYNATASPSERSYETINDSPDAITFSWDYTTNPVSFTNASAVAAGLKPISCITIDVNKLKAATGGAAKLEALEEMLYGDGTDPATLPTPDAMYVWATTGSFPTSGGGGGGGGTVS